MKNGGFYSSILDLLEEIECLHESGQDIAGALYVARTLTISREKKKRERKRQKKLKKPKKKKRKKTSISEFPPLSAPTQLIHFVRARNLPFRTKKSGMMATLFTISGEYDTGPLSFHSFALMSDGTFCFNICGVCPIHKREHDGGAARWQIKQHPHHDYSIIKCWLNDTSFIRGPAFPLF